MQGLTPSTPSTPLRRPQFGYTLDSVGNRTSKAVAGISMPAAQTEAYQYDAIDQLTNVAYGAARTTAFNYDATGNRTSVADSAGIVPASYAANNLNQYTTVDASAPAYDANGNLTSYAGQTFGYDSEKKLLSITGGTASLSSTYDARRRAVSRTVNGVTTYFVWDGWSLIEERDTLGDVTAKYIHGAMIDELLAKTDTVSTVYYHHDGLGSTVALTSDTGALLESSTYDVFGRPSFFGPTGLSIPVSASQNRFLFTGREWIGEVETYDYRNRAYSAELGRFLQTDPIGFDAADVNLYRYVGNNPMNYFDPLGLSCDDKENERPSLPFSPIEAIKSFLSNLFTSPSPIPLQTFDAMEGLYDAVPNILEKNKQIQKELDSQDNPNK